jgi:hypothetical protein
MATELMGPNPHQTSSTSSPGAAWRDADGATGLSVRQCAEIKSGERVPHPREWDALRSL